MDVGVYGRLSVAKRAEDLTELAIDRQHERVAEFCKAREWNPVHFYQDIDPAYRKPGQRKPPRRDDFEQSLADIEAGVIRGIVFFKLDRFVRDHGDFERALEVCEAHRAILASVTEPLDTSTPMGQAIARLLVTFARLESQTMALRLSAQAEQQARLGQPWRGGRHRAYGYEGRIVDDDGNVTNRDRVGVAIVQEEADVINELADRLLGEGRKQESEGEVVRWLNEQGIPAPEGGRWSRGKLRSLMTKPRLAGQRVYRGEVVAEAVWPAILDRQRFERLQRLFGQRARPGRPATRWLVSGIALCELCRAPLEVRGHKAGKRYVCDSQAQRAGRERPGCGRVTIMAEPVDRLIAARVLDRLAGPRLQQVDRQLDTAELRAIHKQREDDRQALVEAARDRFVNRTLAVRAYLEVKAELEKRIAEADRRLDQDGSGAVLASLPRLRSELDEVWEAADIEQRREIVRAAVRYVLIRPATRRGAGLDPERVVIPKDAWKV